jgi:flagellar M-ring protein FliF
VLPDAGSFRRNRQAPSASVILRTESPGDFASGQAIRHLVSAAVPGMSIDQVTVLSTDGTILAAGGDGFNATPAKMVTLEKTLAKDLQDNIRKTLAPYLGLDNFEISVAARLNTDKRQINETSYNPDSRVERSVRVVKETGSSQNANARTAVGVEQNVPAEQAPGAAPSGEQSKKQNERREELTNYEVGGTTISTVSEGYRVENLTIAVVVNRKRLLAALGEGATPEAVDKQLKEVERLVGSAAGIDAKRGDRVTIAAVDFMQGTLEPIPAMGIGELLLRQSGSVVNAVAILGMAFLLIWFGLRPATKALLDAKPVEAAAASKELRADRPTPEQIAERKLAGSEAQPNLIADLTSKLGRTPQKKLEQMIDFDEEQAAAILKQWMRGAKSA